MNLRKKIRGHLIGGAICIATVALAACGGHTQSEREETVKVKVKKDTLNVDTVDSKKYDMYDAKLTYSGGDVCVSEDKRVTIESGLLPWGGNNPGYWAKWSIEDGNGKHYELKFEDAPYIDNVHAIRKNDGSTYYIVSCYQKTSGSVGVEWLEAYILVGDTIKQVGVRNGGNKTEDPAFYIEYYMPDWFEATNGAGYDWLFEYDVATKNIYAPIAEERFLTDRYTVWHFNGERFVCIGEKPHRNLYKGLCDYNRLICYFPTKDYIIRVDSLKNGELRYASWRKPKTMADKPDVVLKGGIRRQHPVAIDELQPCDDYRFKMSHYEYIVNYCEIKKYSDGHSGRHYDYLLIKRDGRTVLKQELLQP